jgi:hypothetical protein
MVNYTDRIEEHKKRLKLIEQEYLMTMGKIKELEELQKESEEKKEGK